jgi:hypothetical protein
MLVMTDLDIVGELDLELWRKKEEENGERKGGLSRGLKEEVWRALWLGALRRWKYGGGV